MHCLEYDNIVISEVDLITNVGDNHQQLTDVNTHCLCCFAGGAGTCSLSRASDPACKRCVQDIAVGWDNLCVVLFDGSVACAGYSNYGENWDGKIGSVPELAPAIFLAGRNISSVGTGWGHSCALTATWEGSNNVLCVGDGSFGQLGDGKQNSSKTPVAVQGLPPSPVAVLDVGIYYSCVAYADLNSLVHCWGHGYSVAAAIPGTAGAMTVAVATGIGDACAVMKDSTVVCWNRFTAAVVLEGLQNVVRVAAAGHYSCAIVQGIGSAGEDSLWCWYTVESTNTPTYKPRRIEGLPSGILLDAVAGHGHICVLVKGTTALGGEIYCWGFNDAGQLGQGYLNATTQPEPDPTQNTATPLLVKGVSNVTTLYGGRNAICAVTASQQVLCWGCNCGGMLAFRSYELKVPVPTAMRGLCA